MRLAGPAGRGDLASCAAGSEDDRHHREGSRTPTHWLPACHLRGLPAQPPEDGPSLGNPGGGRGRGSRCSHGSLVSLKGKDIRPVGRRSRFTVSPRLSQLERTRDGAEGLASPSERSGWRQKSGSRTDWGQDQSLPPALQHHAELIQKPNGQVHLHAACPMHPLVTG